MNKLMTASPTSSLPRSEVVPAATLGDAEREQMFLLLSDYFDGVTRERFDADISEKESVILLREDHGLRLSGEQTEECYFPRRKITGPNRFVIVGQTAAAQTMP